MLRFFFPEDVDFHSPMSAMFDLIKEGTDVYLEATEKGPLSGEDKDRLLTRLKGLEVKGDDIVRAVSADLKRTFTPPFSQMELRRMFERLDNMLDMLDESAKIIIHAGYRDDFPDFVAAQLHIFKKGLAEASRCVSLLKNPRKNIDSFLLFFSRIMEIEKEGDEIYWENKKKLSAIINAAAADNRLSDYRRSVMDEKALDLMESLVDMLVEIIKVVEGMIIEHA